jgi:hypothetical protein
MKGVLKEIDNFEHPPYIILYQIICLVNVCLPIAILSNSRIYLLSKGLTKYITLIVYQPSIYGVVHILKTGEYFTSERYDKLIVLQTSYG